MGVPMARSVVPMSCHPPEDARGRRRSTCRLCTAPPAPGSGAPSGGYREAATVAEQVTESGCEAGELHPPHLLRVAARRPRRSRHRGGWRRSRGPARRNGPGSRQPGHPTPRLRPGRQVEAAQRLRHLDRGSRTGDGDEHGARQARVRRCREWLCEREDPSSLLRADAWAARRGSPGRRRAGAHGRTPPRSRQRTCKRRTHAAASPTAPGESPDAQRVSLHRNGIRC